MTLAEIEREMAVCADPSDMAILCRAHALQSGVITQDRAGEITVVQNATPVQQPVESSDAPQKFYKVLYPHNNDRIEIYASSPKELAAKERTILQMYGKR